MTSMLLRNRLLASTMIAGVTLLASSTAFAQAAAPATTAKTAAAEAAVPEDETIIVTGSRIASASLTSTTPLQVVDALAIESTGAANIQDVLLQSPVFGTPTFSRTNTNFGTSGVGLSTVDLRNLGTARTLVLIDGRRVVSGNANDQAVDLNFIPTPFIQRVEILTGGASSIYGSDAVAGVVNFIYKKNFEGIEANVQGGVSQRGDDTTKQANLLIGANIAGGRGNVMAYVGYSQDGSVFSRDRQRSAIDQTSTGAGVTGSINDLFSVTQPFFSSFAPQGRFFTRATPTSPDATAGTFDKNGNFISGFSANGTPTRAADGFNRSQFRTISVPVERYLIATRATYELFPGVSAFLEGTFAKSHAVSELEPFPVTTSGVNGIFQGTGGYFPVEQRLANGTIFRNPFVPTALYNKLIDVDGDGLRDVSFTRRLTDIANRGNVSDRTTYRIVAGLNGEVFKTWTWDAYFNYGRTDDNQTSTGQVNLNNFRNALVVTQDATGKLVCADLNARVQGCQPANVFGANTLSAAAAQYIRADGNRTAFAQQIDYGANLQGDLIKEVFGAGPLAVAVGFERRVESSAAAFDALQQAGLNGGNAIPNTSGRFDVSEGYIQGRLPVLKDRPFFNELTLEGAFRASKYSTIGTVYSWNYGGQYSPVPGLTFRVVNARATRAPNVTELFQGASQNFPTGLNDPCTGITAATGGVLGATCLGYAGVSSNLAQNGGVFTVTQADRQGISGLDTGNPNLNEEKADTLTAGIVLAPKQIEWLRNFTLTVDYNRTRIAGAIVATPRQFILDQCFRFGNPAFCQFVTRRPTNEGANSAGSLLFVNQGVTNSGGVFSSTIDTVGTYVQPLDRIGVNGQLSLSVAYTHVLQAYSQPTPGADLDFTAGEIGASKDRFLATIGLHIGAVTFEYRGSYFSGAYLDDQFVAGFTEDDGVTPIDRHDRRVRVGARYYSDLQGKVAVGDHFEFYAGVNNLLDASPPPIYSNLPGDVTGTETDAGTYDAVGRRFYAGIRVKY